MAAPMRSASSATGQEAPTAHRPRVADFSSSAPPPPPHQPLPQTSTSATSSSHGTSALTTVANNPQIRSLDHLKDHRSTNAISSSIPSTAPQEAVPTGAASANFEYDDNEWDIGIGDLIIDLDADIEKTNEGTSVPHGQQHHQHQQISAQMALNAGGAQASKQAATAKMHIEHSATADKGLKMKIKRTKPGTKTSEAKHEIVKSNEQNGNVDQLDGKSGNSNALGTKHGVPSVNAALPPNQNSNSGNSKRGSSGHRRDKAREKHSSATGPNPDPKSSNNQYSKNNTAPPQQQASPQQTSAVTVNVSEMNGLVRVSAPQMPPRSVFTSTTSGPGPPQGAPGPPPPNPAAATAQGSAAKPEQSKVAQATPIQTVNQVQQPSGSVAVEERSSSPPPAKKFKTENKDVNDVCVGTSVGTITEPECLGPCEPGTSVTLEGIVWHETEGGVLVVNVTWRGKTYVGTLLDCTRHDWAPPRFCDSPTSDLDNRTPKGRETRSSVHSKLRNGGAGGSATKGRRNGSTGPGPAPSSPTPFLPPRPEPGNKRKNRVGEEEVAQPTGKKTKVLVPPPLPILPIISNPAPCGSPPPSPILLECPEPNCSKKYKHINGLKYHQSHAHGSTTEDDDTKDVTSMSENDESNIDAPSPVTPVKSPEKTENSPPTPVKKEETSSTESQITTSSTTPSPGTPISVQDLGQETVPSPPTNTTAVEAKSIVKPGVLRYSSQEEFPAGLFSGNKPVSGSLPNPVVNPTALQHQQLPNSNDTPSESLQPCEPEQQTTFTNHLVNMPSQQQQFTQPSSLIIPSQNPSNQNPISPPSPNSNKISQFKVKPTAALMPEDNKTKPHIQNSGNSSINPPANPNLKGQTFKKKNHRKSPAGSPMPPEQSVYGVDDGSGGREEVQSPAYSDISDDGAPVVEAEDKKNPDKKTEQSPLPHMPNYGMYPYYGQPHQYMVPQQENKTANNEVAEKQSEKSNVVIEKETSIKAEKIGPEFNPQQKIMPQHYYQYGYMTGYPSYMDQNYGPQMVQPEEKVKEERIKESPSPVEQHTVKQPTPIPNPIQVPTPGKVKTEAPNIKEKHQNENHQILKESIEIKNQMTPYLYSRPQPPQPQPSHHQPQREEDVRRFYVYDQRRKESEQQHRSGNTPSKSSLVQSPSMKLKEPKTEEKKEKEVKQEGVKPTMETQGPPPPPTSQYAYIHPGYMQSAHYGALSFDPNHPMYRGIMVPGPYSNPPYLHAQMPRYHAPEDLSRAPPATKALDMLQHHAQYYSSHKIHELQERAIKSPTPKTSVASSSPSTNQQQGPPPQMSAPPTSQASSMTPTSGKQTPGDGKDSRSPPPQRHVHTHHHTHVGLGYPMYPAPYGAAVLASQQAAAVTVINPYPTK